MYERALRAINLQEVDGIPTAMVLVSNAEFVRRMTGLDMYGQTTEAFAKLYRILDVDFAFSVPTHESVESVEGTVYRDFDDRLTEGGFHVVWKGCRIAYTERKSNVWIVERPFKTFEDLLGYLDNYDPLADEPRSAHEIAEEYQRSFEKSQNPVKNTTLIGGWWYLTLFQYALMKIGWPFLARLMFEEPNMLERLLDRFAELSRRNVEAWSMTEIKVLGSHDDLATQLGPVASPDWLRKNVISRYSEIWKPAKEKGIKVIFISDGNYEVLMDDIARAGADGFWAPDIPISTINLAERFTGRKIVAQGINHNVLMKGDQEQILSEVGRSLDSVRAIPALFLFTLIYRTNYRCRRSTLI